MPKRVARHTWNEQKRRYYTKHRRHKLNTGRPWTARQRRTLRFYVEINKFGE